MKPTLILAVALFAHSAISATPVSADFALSAKSRFMNYGLVKGKDPIAVPAANIRFFDWVYFDYFALFDLTKGNGKRGGYGNRAGKYRKWNASAGLRHGFNCDETVGTLVLDVSYMYEYLPRRGGKVFDTQFVNLRIALPDLPLEPALWIERDIMLDDGTYVNAEIGHTFRLSDDWTLRPALGQGFGNTKRTAGMFADFDHAGLMDTSASLTLTYRITENLSISAFAAYFDYLLDANMREAARKSNASWGSGEDKSWNLVGGISLKTRF